MSREEEQEQTIRMRKVTTQAGRIGTLTPGGGTYVNNMHVVYNGNVVTEVPVGAQFQIRCGYYIENTAGGTWSAAVTVIDTIGGEVKNYKQVNNLMTFPSVDHFSEDDALLDDLGANVMPDHDLNLRFWPWANDALLPSGPPNQSLW